MNKKITRLESPIKARLVAIVGPTGSGKTGLAKNLAQKFNAKVISADSRQIYKGMNIGTAKDLSFPQDLIDIIEPDKTFSVAQYKELAEELINEYLAMKTLPILVGGTGLYIDAVIYGYVLPNIKEESGKIRERLDKLSESELFDKLKEIDPKTALKIDSKNKRRLVRALEVWELTKKPFSDFQKKEPKFDALIIGISVDRETLYAKIDARIDQMIKDGLVEEIRELISKYRKDLPSLNTIGYKEIINYIDGKYSLKEAIEKIKFNTHAYVRRQDTWFKRNKDIKWVSSAEEAEKLIKNFLKI